MTRNVVNLRNYQSELTMNTENEPAVKKVKIVKGTIVPSSPKTAVVKQKDL